jgi:hypothetical protein
MTALGGPRGDLGAPSSGVDGHRPWGSSNGRWEKGFLIT